MDLISAMEVQEAQTDYTTQLSDLLSNLKDKSQKILQELSVNLIDSGAVEFLVSDEAVEGRKANYERDLTEVAQAFVKKYITSGKFVNLDGAWYFRPKAENKALDGQSIVGIENEAQISELAQKLQQGGWSEFITRLAEIQQQKEEYEAISAAQVNINKLLGPTIYLSPEQIEAILNGTATMTLENFNKMVETIQSSAKSILEEINKIPRNEQTTTIIDHLTRIIENEVQQQAIDDVLEPIQQNPGVLAPATKIQRLWKWGKNVLNSALKKSDQVEQYETERRLRNGLSRLPKNLLAAQRSIKTYLKGLAKIQEGIQYKID